MINKLSTVLDILEDFVRAHFDKLLLTAILVFLAHLQRWDMANTVLGAIVTLTTGKMLQRTNGNGHGKPPAE